MIFSDFSITRVQKSNHICTVWPHLYRSLSRFHWFIYRYFLRKKKRSDREKLWLCVDVTWLCLFAIHTPESVILLFNAFQHNSFCGMLYLCICAIFLQNILYFVYDAFITNLKWQETSGDACLKMFCHLIFLQHTAALWIYCNKKHLISDHCRPQTYMIYSFFHNLSHTQVFCSWGNYVVTILKYCVMTYCVRERKWVKFFTPVSCALLLLTNS